MDSRMLGALSSSWLHVLSACAVLTGLQAAAVGKPPSTHTAQTRPASRSSDTGAGAGPPAATPGPGGAIESTVVVKGQDRVEIHVADVPLSTILRMLSTQSRKNIIASPAVKGSVTADLFDVTFREALDCILRANNCGFEERDRFIYVYTLQELAEVKPVEEVEPIVARVFRLNYITVTDIQPLLQPLLSKEGKIAATPEAKTGLDTSVSEAGGNTLSDHDILLVYDTPSRIREIERVIKEIDVRPKQVLIEATILRAELNENNALGIDFNMVSGVDFEMLASTSPGVTDLTTGSVPQAELNNTNMTARTDFNGAVDPGGFTFGIIKDQVAVFIRALEQVSDTTVLANPKILALNKQRGQVIVGRRDGYLTTTVTETTAIQTVEFLETGTQLIFRPFIGDDGYVRMEIHPEDSTGSLNESNLPFETTTEVTSNILVRDGHTILIGGLFRESTNTVRGQVPILGNLPVIGALFRATSDMTNREEVIILLTVHIVKDEAAYAKVGHELAEDAMKLRIGMRRGIQAFGRDRLALAHYHKALLHYRAGRLGKALWDARMALHISPKHLPAIRLTEKLVGRHSCDYRVGSIRSFISRRLMGDSSLGAVGPPEPGVPDDPRILPSPDGQPGPTDDPSDREGAEK